MKNLILIFILLGSFTAWSKPFHCEGIFDSGVFKFSISGAAEVSEGSQLSMKLQDFDFEIKSVKGENDVSFHATVTDPDGNDTLAIYPGETNIVRVHVKKQGILHLFDCVAR